MKPIVYREDLIENRGVRRHERVGDFEAATQPVFRVQDLVLVGGKVVFLNEPDFSWVAVETDGEVGNTLHDFGVGERKLLVEESRAEGF